MFILNKDLEDRVVIDNGEVLLFSMNLRIFLLKEIVWNAMFSTSYHYVILSTTLLLETDRRNLQSLLAVFDFPWLSVSVKNFSPLLGNCQVMQGFEDLITSCTEHSLWRLEPAHKGHVQISVDVCHFDKFFMVESSSIGRYEEKSIQ